MTTREYFQRIMRYEPVDRMPVIHWGCWTETLARWRAEGLPEKARECEFFKASPFWYWMSGPVMPRYMELLPGFPEETLEETGTYRIYRGSSGIVMKIFKGQSSLPHSMDFRLKTARDWPEYKQRLQPDPRRLQYNLADFIQKAETIPAPVALPVGSLMGWVRDWMGVEGMTYMIYDEPDCFADMVQTISDLACWAIDQIVPRMKVKPELCFVWEDICGSTGPFVSPGVFRRFVAPGYLKIRNRMNAHGIEYLCVDSDGKIEALIRPWMDAGVNMLFPIEVGTWRESPERIRKIYGRNLRLVGGFDKLVLEKDRAAIDAEIRRHIPLLKAGGYWMMPDHVITPGTPLANYQYYLEQVRQLRF